MHLNFFKAWFTSVVSVLLLSFPVFSADLPKITAIRLNGTNLTITTTVPQGVNKVTLEGRSRVRDGAWAPLSIQRLVVATNLVTFAIPASSEMQLLRVHGENEFLPFSIDLGQRQSSFIADSNLVSSTSGVNNAIDGPAATAPTQETVVESDIWKVDGNRIYFFNQTRGLQIVDISNPAAPVLQSTVSMAASGEEMYLVDHNTVALLTYDTCDSSMGSVVLMDVSNPLSPKALAAVPLQGYLRTSRLIGSVLYVATDYYQQQTNGSAANPVVTWTSGTLVSSIDLQKPATPVAKGSLLIPGWAQAVAAAPDLLMIAQSTYSSSGGQQAFVGCIDIRAGDGTLKWLGQIPTFGIAQDKYKLDYTGGILSTISESFDSRVESKIETFRISPDVVGKSFYQKVGELLLDSGESLYATRFDGNRAYVVTYKQIDPLWIVDLSDPAKLKLNGGLQVPGWSTYLQPFGNRLITLGIDNSNSWRVAVSLFDVANASQPKLLSRAYLGDNYSWSEANYDDKAFSIFPDSGLILIPRQVLNSNAWDSGVQLVDWTGDILKTRGAIDHQVVPRRATAIGNTVVSISSRDFISSDITDRDHPLVRSDIELSWPVSRAFAVGSYLVEQADTSPLRVVSQSTPDVTLSTLALSNSMPVLGSYRNGNRLYLMQGQYSYYWLADSSSMPTNAPNVVFSVIDLSALPQLKLLGSWNGYVDQMNGYNWEGMLVRSNLLVFSSKAVGFYPLYAAAGPQSDLISPLPFWRGSSSHAFIAFDLADESQPSLESSIATPTGSGWMALSGVFTTNGLVYAGRELNEPLYKGTNYYVDTNIVYFQQTNVTLVTNITKVASGSGSGATYQTNVYYSTNVVSVELPQVETNAVPDIEWQARYFVDVIDYNGRGTPEVRKPVSVPGEFAGISHSGTVMYSRSSHYQSATSDWSTTLEALYYDGVSAFLLDSMTVPEIGSSNLRVWSDRMAVGWVTTNSSALKLFQIALPSGKWSSGPSLALDGNLQNMELFGDVMILEKDNGLEAVRMGVAQMQSIAKSARPGCWYGMPLDQGDWSEAFGYWRPLGDYGVSETR